MPDDDFLHDERTYALKNARLAGLIIRYCVPTILATLINVAYNIVDRIFVGRYCGEDALAALTVCLSPTLVFLAFSMLIGQGSASLISIKLGEKKRRDAEKILGQAIVLFFCFSAVIACVGAFWVDGLLTLFGATDRILPIAAEYYTILLFGYIFEKISFGLNNIIRAEGSPSYALQTMVIGGLVNIALDYLFIVRFGWGVKGAAYATVIGQACASLWVFRFYFCKLGILRVHLNFLRVHFDLLKKVLAMGSPAFMVQGLSSLSTAVFIYQATVYGAEGAVAVVGVIMTATVFLFLPVIGMSMGIQPIIGYNWGARNYPRALKTWMFSVGLATAACFAGFVFIEAFPELLFGIFLPDGSGLLDMGQKALRIVVFCAPLVGANIITAGYFQATGRPKFAIFLTTLRQAFFLGPLLIFLPQFFGIAGIWMSFPLSDAASFIYTAGISLKEYLRVKRGQKADFID